MDPVSMSSIPNSEMLTPEARVSETADFEIVLGRRQVASVLFVAIVILVVLSAVSYLAGKARLAGAVPPMVVAFPPTPAVPLLQATIARSADDSKSELPLFAEPVARAVYIQIGALDRGIAIVVAEGLRKQGLEAFVASGPADKIFRVLIGPLPDPASFARVKEAVDQLGLSNFVRKYQ